MAIREATTDDIEAIRSVAKASWEHDYPDILSRETVSEGFDDWYSRTRLETQLSSSRGLVYLAEKGETVAGFVHGLVDGDDGVILRLYVHPSHRKHGLGTDLFEHIAGVLSEYDCARLRAMVLAENGLGNEFYRGLGFEQVSTGQTTVGTEQFAEHTYEREVA